jgi:hypothetical protein
VWDTETIKKQEVRQMISADTIRQWTDKELARIGEDSPDGRKLTTVFMNVSTFSERAMRRYPYNIRKTYEASWWGEAESIVVYAVDDETVKWFLRENYIRLPDDLVEVTRQTREVLLGK